MLRIGYDAKRLFNNFTGLGNYSRTLVRNLAEYYPEHAYYLFTPKIKPNNEHQFFVNNPQFEVVLPKQKWKGPWWRSYGVNKVLTKKKIDLYHGLSHELPVGIRKTKVRSVVTIHDLIFKYYPKHYKYLDKEIYNRKFKYACLHSDRVIAISESTKADIIRFYQVPEDKVRVVYQSCDPRFQLRFSEERIQAIIQEHGLPKAFMLYVGSIIERKNLLGIVKAMRTLKREERLPLVVIGKGGEYKDKVNEYLKKHKLQKEVIYAKIENNVLPAIYQAAAVFIYPSVYEGFGLPILEAIWSGTPVITSNQSSLPEAAGPGSILVDPNDFEELGAQIAQVLADRNLRETMISEGLEHVQQFKGEVVSQKVMDTYLELV